VNPVAVRCFVDSAESLLEAVQEAQTALEDAVAHSQLPFQEVGKEVDVPHLPGVNPIFQVCAGCWLVIRSCDSDNKAVMLRWHQYC
jgi:hypothetical protein